MQLTFNTGKLRREHLLRDGNELRLVLAAHVDNLVGDTKPFLRGTFLVSTLDVRAHAARFDPLLLVSAVRATHCGHVAVFHSHVMQQSVLGVTPLLCRGADRLLAALALVGRLAWLSRNWVGDLECALEALAHA